MNDSDKAQYITSTDPEIPIYFCDGCGKEIYADDDYFPIFDERYCIDCIEGQ